MRQKCTFGGNKKIYW